MFHGIAVSGAVRHVFHVMKITPGGLHVISELALFPISQNI